MRKPEAGREAMTKAAGKTLPGGIRPGGVLLPGALLAGAAAAGVLGIYRYAFYSPVGEQNDDTCPITPVNTPELKAATRKLIDTMNERPFRRVVTYSFDGLLLAGRYFHSDDSAAVAILFPGYRGTPSRDFCGGAQLLLKNGYNVLIVEERACCSSAGHTISFGVNEQKDARTWIRYVREHFGEDRRILLCGISMGASVVLMAAEKPLPPNVLGIIADSPYTTPCAIIEHVGRSKGIPMKAAMPLVYAAARFPGGFDLDGADAVRAVKSIKIPVLIIHGEADTYVPPEMSEEIRKANPELIERYTFPGAGHGLSYLYDPERYEKIFLGFCERVGLKG